MTYDELRDYIDKFDVAGMVDESAVKALRAVVEMHKPYESIRGTACFECSQWQEMPHPCPTIQAIEKEFS